MATYLAATCIWCIAVHGFKIAFKDVDSLSVGFMNGGKSIHEI